MSKRISCVVSLCVSLTLATAGQADQKSTTPGSSKVFLFSTAGGELPMSLPLLGLSAAVAATLKSQGYTVTEMIDSSGCADDDPKDATVVNFLKTNKAGVLVVLVHGDKDAITVERYKTKEARDRAFRKYIADGSFNEHELSTSTSGEDTADRPRCFGIDLTARGIEDRWSDENVIVNNTIVVLLACEALPLADAFAARDFFGYDRCVSNLDAFSDAGKLLDRLAGGVVDPANKDARRTTAAFAAGGYSAGFRHKRRGDVDTVLAPSITQHVPRNNEKIRVPRQGVDGAVVFDARMDRTMDPANVITVDGCGARINNATWSSPSSLDFSLELNRPGEAILTVHSSRAIAERDFQNKFDGNTDPPGSNHVGPNGDDFKWKVNCVR